MFLAVYSQRVGLASTRHAISCACRQNKIPFADQADFAVKWLPAGYFFSSSSNNSAAKSVQEYRYYLSFTEKKPP